MPDDKLLFTPGPLTTSKAVKKAMLHDLGSRDNDFIEIVAEIREKLVELCANTEDYTSVLIPGSGTYAVESVISSVIPPEGKLLVLINGAYGERIRKIAEVHRIPLQALTFSENEIPDPDLLYETLAADQEITHVAVIHCETTTGIVNPISLYGNIVHRHKRSFIVDAMSSFGAYELDMNSFHIDYLVSSANKCIEGVPGFSYVIARRDALKSSKGYARTLSLDLYAQWAGFEKDGQFRFTPPVQALLAFHQALIELEEEGGVRERISRYRRNNDICVYEMKKMGFKPNIGRGLRGHIITSFYYPEHPNFDFQAFYEILRVKGFVIYPGKVSDADCFRIGNIGHINASAMRALMRSVAAALAEMNISLVAQKV
jgi:2-aminoethylphosphonate-pyruvate transaminase